MLIIPIDNFNKRSGILGDPIPKISMKAKGEIRLNIAAVNLLGIKDAQPVYLHFYAATDEYFIKTDNDKTHGLRLVFEKDTAKCSVFAKNTSLYFINLFNIGADSVMFELEDSDFGKFKLIHINS